jgi:hypothetical protein
MKINSGFLESISEITERKCNNFAREIQEYTPLVGILITYFENSNS